MNRKGFTLLLSAILMITTMAVMVSASGWQQSQTDEANAGIAADSAPVAAPDDFDVRAGEDKWAYRGGVADKPPSTCDVPSTEFPLYTAISADDGTYQSDFSNSNYAAHRFNFSIDENKVNFITKLNVTWNGKGWHDNGGTDNGTYLYIYNFSTPGYEELANNNVGTDATLTGEVTSSISNYINSGNVTVLVVQNTAGSAFSASHIETDYVRVVVTP